MLLKDVLKTIDGICPFSLQEEWDNSGLQIGDPEHNIKKILVAFDLTAAVVAEAVERGADMVITHHPFFFKGIRAIDLSTAKGKMIRDLIAHDIALVACHTNLDKVGYGVSAVLGERLGMTDCRPFMAEGDDIGFGVIGNVEEMTLADFAEKVKAALDIPALRVEGDENALVTTVVAMGGAGSDFMTDAKAMGADVYVTADLKYHDGQLGAEMGLNLIDAGHFETEAAVLAPFREKLANALPEIDFEQAEKVCSYWKIL